MSSSVTPSLFQPIHVGAVQLRHRVVMCPMTRFRTNASYEHGDLAVEYYGQRATVPGTLLITEGTLISPKATGVALVPGIWSEAQTAAWKKVVDAVHAKGSYIFLQLWTLGRAASPDLLKADGNSLVSASDIPLEGTPAPRPLTLDEIKEYAQFHGTAAANAVHKAGFDGVELQGGNGYLIDQFLQTTANKRTDKYGGSIENRTRFALEVIDAVAAAVGADKLGIRLSPWATFQGMGMDDPVPTFTHLVTQIRETHPDFAYIHVIDKHIPGGDAKVNIEYKDDEATHFLRAAWGSKPYIAAAAFDRETAIKTVEKRGGLIAFGKDFLSNPDLPLRLKDDIKLNPYNMATFYTHGAEGYTDYPFASTAA